MFKKILAFVMAMVLVFSLVPAVAAAEADYVQITSADQFVTGQYVLVADNGYAPTALDGTWVLSGTPAVNNGTIAAADAAGYIWTITVDGTTAKLTDANGVTVAPKGGNNNGIKSADYSWDVSFENGTFRFAGVGSDTVILACNSGSQGGNKFRGYKTTTLSGSYAHEYFSYFTLYKLGGDVPAVPEVTEPVVEPTVAPTEPEVTEPVDTVLTIEQAIAMGSAMAHNTYTETKYTVTGVITEVYNTQYGNMKLTDEAGNILTIYGTYGADGSTRYDALDVKPVAGDTVTIYGPVGQYNNVAQIKNGWIVNHIPAEPEVTEPSVEPTEPEVTEPTTPVEPGENGSFVQITSADQLVTGKYVLVAGNGYAPTVLDGTWVLSGTPAVSNGVVSAENAAGYIWDITVEGTTAKLTDANGVTVAPKGGNNNGIISADYSWDVLFSDGTFQFAGVGSDTVILACNSGSQGGNKFRGYKTSTLTGSYAHEYFSYFTLYKLEESTEPEQVIGDMTGDSEVNNDDVVLLLWHTLFPEDYPLTVDADLNKDGSVNNDDVVLLLWHTLFPEDYPL